jgi:hypothetical protein
MCPHHTLCISTLQRTHALHAARHSTRMAMPSRPSHAPTCCCHVLLPRAAPTCCCHVLLTTLPLTTLPLPPFRQVLLLHTLNRSHLLLTTVLLPPSRQVLLLAPRGRVVYHGPRARALPYLAKFGHPCPAHTNPAEVRRPCVLRRAAAHSCETLYLRGISAVSPLYLRCISVVSPHLERRATLRACASLCLFQLSRCATQRRPRSRTTGLRAAFD